MTRGQGGCRILFVDDEPCMREMLQLILKDEGHDVVTAVDGLDALAKMRMFSPDLIISDLNMPRMSGQEFLSVVRRRFPSVPVIALSGAFDEDTVPFGVMADAFYPKSRCHPEELIRTISELACTPLTRATNYRQCHPASVQHLRRGYHANGSATIALTCPECLRAFTPLRAEEPAEGIECADCVFCGAPVTFILDAVSETSAPPVSAVLGAATSAAAAG